ncbi:MAG: ankyrin repeat domain-containing protein, partial [Asticcacaulis sp.]
MPDADEALIRLVQVISRRETASALNQIAASPNLALARLTDGTPLEWPKASYAGDTALHIAAAVYEIDVARRLLSMGADVMARNRRGAEPLHYAAVGSPGSALWAPERQAAMIEWLVKAGA